MNILYILGSIGGTLYLITSLFIVIIEIFDHIKDNVCKYKKYKQAYYDLVEKSKESLNQIGFKSESDKEEEKYESILEKMEKAHKLKYEKLYKESEEKIKDYENYYDEYWESIPVDDEFIEEEEHEDEEDKYPLLKETVKRFKER